MIALPARVHGDIATEIRLVRERAVARVSEVDLLVAALDAAPAQAQLAPGARTGRNRQFDLAPRCGHFDLSAQCSLPGCDRQIKVDIALVHAVVRMGHEGDLQIKVAGFALADAGAALVPMGTSSANNYVVNPGDSPTGLALGYQYSF